MKRWLVLVLVVSVVVIAMGAMFKAGYEFHQPREIVREIIVERWHEPEVVVVETEVKEIQAVIYRYPNTPPYEAFADPIDFDQALVLLYGMRASHIQALNWEFESDPGFGIADKNLQRQFIKWYDQLIDIFWRMERGVEG